MQDDIDFYRPALSVEEARGLAAKVADLVIERDRTREENELLRSILSELAAIREMLDTEPGAMIAAATTNGHLLTEHRSTLKASIDPDAAGDDLEAGDSDSEPEAGDRLEQASDDRRGELETRGSQTGKAPTATVDSDEADVVSDIAASASDPEAFPPAGDHDDYPNEPKASDVNASQIEPSVERSGDTAPDTVVRPPEGSLMWRILTLIEASTRPRRPWQVQRALSLPRTPSAELSRLVAMGCVERIKEGVYGARGRRYDDSMLNEGN